MTAVVTMVYGGMFVVVEGDGCDHEEESVKREKVQQPCDHDGGGGYGATYQRLIDTAFDKQIGRNLEAYVDDLVIKSTTQERIIDDMRETFDTLEEETAFQEMKKLLKTLPTLIAPVDDEILYLYLSVANEAFSSVLIAERNKIQKPVYFVNKALTGSEINYASIEKIVYALILTSRSTVKGQVMADYLAEMSGELEVINERTTLKPVLGKTWDWFTDGASCAEDSQLVANQFNGSFDAHDSSMQKYLQLLRESTERFEHFELSQVPRSQNKKADALSKLAALTFSHFQKQVWVEELPIKSIDNDLMVASVEEEQPNWMEPILQYIRNDTLPRPGNVKFLIVVVDYFTKWVEAKAVRTITGVQVQNFVWECIVCRFGIPRELVSNNGAQIAKDPFKTWCIDLHIIQKFTSVAHPPANGLCEVTNRDIVSGIKKWLCEKRTEILVPTHRIANFEEEANDAALSENLNFIEERRLMATITEANNKQQIAKGSCVLLYKASFYSLVKSSLMMSSAVTSSRSLIAVILGRGILAMPC
ncbi:uncharacterized protein [Rutidosis leptorrhynchoides]|uniref:uncharacterized protein n=1 Tax=Rutidosis leptorrhynchoides TaxID=125765 RepID=UPI003A9925EB